MQIPILSGIYTDTDGEFRTSLPHNLQPVPKGQGISEGYLRPGEGLVKFSDGIAADRGGIEWRGELYRVQGTKLVKVDANGAITEIGNVAGSGQTTMDYSFDHLAIASSNNLFLYDGTTLTLVTDPDLGDVISFIWIDGRFLTTDGEFLVVTELNDPFAVDPLKFGSSEVDPDPINSVLELRNEVYAVNSNSIEVFSDVGGTGFPFQRIPGAQIQKGSVGTFAATVFDGAIAFVGGGRSQPPSVYLAAGGRTQKIASREIDKILGEISTADLANIVTEAREFDQHTLLYIHLPAQTLVFDAAGSKSVGKLIWYTLSGGTVTKTQYPARNFVYVYDKWIAGNQLDGKLAETTYSVSTQYDTEISWSFGVEILYNEGRGAIIHELELVCLTGNVALGLDPVVTTDWSIDGLTWSQPRTVSAGKQGDRATRVSWRRQGAFKNWRIQRFSGTTDAHISIARLEAQIEGLAV